MGRLFGTDGVRGVANRELTAELALALGSAAARRLASTGEPGRRSPWSAAIRGPAARCWRPRSSPGWPARASTRCGSGVLPTPAVAYLTGAYDADFGVMISASHNPMPDNGIKIFGPGGHKLDDDTEDQIEDLVAAGPECARSAPRSGASSTPRMPPSATCATSVRPARCGSTA